MRSRAFAPKATAAPARATRTTSLSVTPWPSSTIGPSDGASPAPLARPGTSCADLGFGGGSRWTGYKEGSRATGRSSADDALRLQERARDVLGLFLVIVDLVIHFGHRRFVEQRIHLVQHAGDLRIGVECILAHDRYQIVRRPQILVVLEALELQRADHAVGRIAVDDVDLLVRERLIAQADRHLQVFLELDAVLGLEPRQAVLAVAELGAGAELELLRHLREIGQRFQLVLRC